MLPPSGGAGPYIAGADFFLSAASRSAVGEVDEDVMRSGRLCDRCTIPEVSPVKLPLRMDLMFPSDTLVEIRL